MIQNKIYSNFISQILKNFFVFLFIFSIIALTVRAVNFLDLIIESGYPVSTYFTYSILNLFGLIPKFIPLSFLISLMIFILKHNDGEFVILWTSGVNKLKVVNIMLLSSVAILIFYLLFAALVSPYALNKSRKLLSEDKLNSFLPTVRSSEFGDSFKGLTFAVGKKKDNEIQNVFLHDTANNLKGLSSDSSNTLSTTIIAAKGVVQNRKISLINGQIISSKKNNTANELISFDRLNIDLANITTNTIKAPKIQETSTTKLISCLSSSNLDNDFCNKDSKKEMTPNFIRRIILPFYIPVLVLICSFLFKKNKKIFLNKFFIFFYCMVLLVFTELCLRYTGLSQSIKFTYIFSPFILFSIIYLILFYTFRNKGSLNE